MSGVARILRIYYLDGSILPISLPGCIIRAGPSPKTMKFLRLSLAVLLLLTVASAVVRADTFFVVASGNNTLERVTANGTRLNTFAATKQTTPTAIAIDSQGNLYVCDDQTNSTIEKYASDGRDLGTFASTNLHRTYGLAFDGAGNLYAANYGNNTVEKFSSTGTDLGAFVGTGLSGPVGLVFDKSGNLYVANSSNNTIGVFSSTGTLVKTLTSEGLSAPYGLALDASGNLYAGCLGTGSIHRFSATGADLGDYIEAGTVVQPLGLTFDAEQILYVTSESANNVVRFSPEAEPLGVFATLAGNSNPAGIARLVSTNAGTLEYILSGANTTETAGSVALLVRRLGGNTGAITVTYTTANDTALAGTDYTAATGTVSWIDGDTADKTFTIPILDAGRVGGSVDFNVTLSAPTGGAVLGSPATAKVVITDNDTATEPTVLITSPPDGLHVVSGQTVPFAATVTDPDAQLSDLRLVITNPAGVSQQVYETTGSGPYVQEVPTTGYPTGAYTVEALLTDKEGRTDTSTITVTIDAPNPNAAAPTASVLTPLGGLNLKSGSTVAIDLAAAVADGTTLDHLDLYANETLIGSFDANGNPIQVQPTAYKGRPVRQDASPVQSNIIQTTYTLPVQATSQLINMIAVAFDALGQSSVSPVASFQNTVTDDNAPLVAFSNFSGTVQVPVGVAEQANVNASDPDAASSTAAAALVAAGSAGGHPVRQDASTDAVIAELSYFLNGVNLDKPSFVPPYGVNFSVPAPGKYTLHAVATDGAGLSTVSDPVILDATQPPTVTIAAAGDDQAVAGGENGKFVVLRAGDTTAALTVSYKVKGTAVKGVDYKPLAGTVMIPAGATKAKIKVKAIEDAAADGSARKVKVRLLPAADGSYTVGDPSGAKIKVVDND